MTTQLVCGSSIENRRTGAPVGMWEPWGKSEFRAETGGSGPYRREGPIRRSRRGDHRSCRSGTETPYRRTDTSVRSQRSGSTSAHGESPRSTHVNEHSFTAIVPRKQAHVQFCCPGVVSTRGGAVPSDPRVPVILRSVDERCRQASTGERKTPGVSRSREILRCAQSNRRAAAALAIAIGCRRPLLLGAPWNGRHGGPTALPLARMARESRLCYISL